MESIFGIHATQSWKKVASRSKGSTKAKRDLGNKNSVRAISTHAELSPFQFSWTVSFVVLIW
jgi:hypothetical protein